MVVSLPREIVKRGEYILGELNGWSIEKKIMFIYYLLGILEAKKKRGNK